MRTLNGFDRMSTEEELHQVLAVLNALARNGGALPSDDSEDVPDFWDDTLPDWVDSGDLGSLDDLVEKNPRLKN